jgi:hypothetical protein
MANSDTIKFKSQVYKHVLENQQNLINQAREAMQAAQEGALEEESTKEELMDSFKARMQQDRNMYAKKLQDNLDQMARLKLISLDKTYHKVEFGAIMETDTQIFFIAVALGEISIDGKKIFVISTQSPLYQSMADLKEGEKFTFRDKAQVIKAIY